MKTNKLVSFSLIFALLMVVLLVSPAEAHSPKDTSVGRQTIIQVTLVGTTSYTTPPETGASYPDDTYFRQRLGKEVPHTGAMSDLVVPVVPSSPISSHSGALLGFNGLTHADQRNAGTGIYEDTQFSLEPPDQALCVGKNYVLESVNTALRILTKDGTPVSAPIALNQFFGLAPEIDRVNGLYGDFTSDPKCYFDKDSGTWFLTLLQADVDPSTSAFAGPTSVLIAVSKDEDPTGDWYIYKLDTTNLDTDHPDCPCLGDQPLIGADRNGFYISTNEFPLFANGFNGAQLYAIDKEGLADGDSTVTAVYFDNLFDNAGNPAFSVQPATSPNAKYARPAGGTEYFMSSLDYEGTLVDGVGVWALTNTSSLDRNNPHLSLYYQEVDSIIYGQPLPAEQKDGPRFLGELVGDPLALLNSNDDRMNQVVYAHNQLWGAVNTIVETEDGSTRVGIAYFVVKPRMIRNHTLFARMDKQGYVAVDGNNVMFPAIAVNQAGKGAIVFTLVGPDYFPSAAYTPLSHNKGAGAVKILAEGFEPADGFTGYPSLVGGNGVERWGDYSAAAPDEKGNIWLATEYIPDAPRTLYANWGTFIAEVRP